MNLDQPLFTTIYCCSEEFIVLCRQNKSVQCLICEQKRISIIFVFFTCTEIKTVHVLLTVITHGRGLLHLICQEENKVLIFFCAIIYIVQYMQDL